VQSIVAIFDFGEQDPRSAWLHKMRQVFFDFPALLVLIVQSAIVS
jgi:hypothetical protein